MDSSYKRRKKDILSFSNSYYPNVINSKDIVNRYLAREDLKPFNILQKRLEETSQERSTINVNKAVVYLFNRDLRLVDNKGLIEANKLARNNGAILICLYIICEEEQLAHNASPFQVEYRYQSLKILKKDLLELNIPLVCLNVSMISEIDVVIIEFLKKYNAAHLFSNIEYEVDELKFFIALLDKLLEVKFSFNPIHNTCVVLPGALKSKSRNAQYTVFSPWFKSWRSYIKNNIHILDKATLIVANDKNRISGNYSDLFENRIPPIPKSIALSSFQRIKFKEHYRCGEHEAWKKLENFVNSGKIYDYNSTRNNLDDEGSSNMSIHISSGTISTTAILQYILEKGLINPLIEGKPGVNEWIRQIAWRDFYKHILCYWPHICMFRPFNLDFCDLAWDNKETYFLHWCNGTTGYPIVDASMRQLNEIGYMPNRCRMIVASFLAKHLSIDWRFGEYYFMEKLVDADFASNNGGWQFSASTGADSQPYFRIFNPTLQSKKFDKNGNYIRKWVPELREINDENAIHEPYNSKYASLASQNKYAMPIVNHSHARKLALSRYQEARFGK